MEALLLPVRTASVRGGKPQCIFRRQLNPFSLWKNHPWKHRTDRQTEGSNAVF